MDVLLEDEDDDTEDDDGGGWASIHAVDLLADLKAETAIGPMLRVRAETDWDFIIHDRIILRLPELGAPVLEPALSMLGEGPPDAEDEVDCFPVAVDHGKPVTTGPAGSNLTGARTGSRVRTEDRRDRRLDGDNALLRGLRRREVPSPQDPLRELGNEQAVLDTLVRGESALVVARDTLELDEAAHEVAAEELMEVLDALRRQHFLHVGLEQSLGHSEADSPSQCDE